MREGLRPASHFSQPRPQNSHPRLGPDPRIRAFNRANRKASSLLFCLPGRCTRARFASNGDCTVQDPSDRRKLESCRGAVKRGEASVSDYQAWLEFVRDEILGQSNIGSDPVYHAEEPLPTERDALDRIRADVKRRFGFEPQEPIQFFP